jgi:formylmethanofuran dehydrogenase subunit E
MATAAMEALTASRADDEEIVAIVENNACGVDALQCVTGCTFGKGNLIFHDHGKNVYTLYSRKTGTGVRVLFTGQGIPKELRENREEFADLILSASPEDILRITKVSIQEPPAARVRKSVPCAFCNEMVMETRLLDVGGKQACAPCAQHHGKPQ